MAKVSIIDEVQKIESTIKEEIGKTAMLLQDQFHLQLSMERQDRQNSDNQLHMDLQAQRAVIGKVEEQLVAQQTTYEKLQQQLMDSSKVAADNTAIIELQASLEKVQQEVAWHSAVQRDILQQQALAVDLKLEGGIQEDQMQELRRDFNAQRTSLAEQGSKFIAQTAEVEETKMRLRVVESLLDESRGSLSQKLMATQGAPALEDHCMQSELHSLFVGLKEAVAQLRTDFAVQCSMHQDLVAQRAGLESVRQELNQLKLCSTPASLTMSMGLPEIVQTLRAELEHKVTSLEQKTQLVLAMSTGDNAERAERMNKLAEPSQSGGTSLDKIADVRRLVQGLIVQEDKSTGQQDNSDVKESNLISGLKRMDVSLSSSVPSAGASVSDVASDIMQVGPDSARRKPVEGVSLGSLTYVSPQSERPDGEEGQPPFVPLDLQNALTSLVARIHDTVNAEPTNTRSKSPSPHRSKPAKESVSRSASLLRSQRRSLSFRRNLASNVENAKMLRERTPESEKTSSGRLLLLGASESTSVPRTVIAISPSEERKFTSTVGASQQPSVGESGQSQTVPLSSVGGASLSCGALVSTSPLRQRFPKTPPSVAHRAVLYRSTSLGPSTRFPLSQYEFGSPSPTTQSRPGFPLVPALATKNS